MKAIVVTQDGPALADQAVPRAAANEVVVQVQAAALNRADLHVAAGHKHGRSGGIGSTIGIEWSGTIAEIGVDVPPGLAVGDAVMCSGVGGYAEYAVADWGRVYKLPSSITDFGQAATLPIALQTAHEAVMTSGSFQRGEAVLVHGASSSVGLMTMQVAKYLGAGLVVGTSTTAERRSKLADFGADVAVDSRDANWPEQVLAATGGKGVDLVIDFIAGDTINASMQATRLCGRIVNVGRMGGFSGTVDFDLHSARRIRYIGVSFRTRTYEEVRDIAHNMRTDLWPAVEAGTLRLPVSRRFAFADFAAALDCMRQNAHFGKVVLEL